MTHQQTGRQTTFEMNVETAEIIAGLQKIYGVKTIAATLKRALAIALILSRNADQDGVIHLRSKDGREVLVPQRV